MDSCQSFGFKFQLRPYGWDSTGDSNAITGDGGDQPVDSTQAGV